MLSKIILYEFCNLYILCLYYCVACDIALFSALKDSLTVSYTSELVGWKKTNHLEYKF